jgi:MFS family permease
MSNSAGASPAARRGLGAFLAILALVELSSGATQVYITPLLPTIALRFHVSVGALSWALIAFTLSTAVTTPLLTKLGDLYGHRRVLTVEVALVAIGSLLVATAPNFGLILAGRVLQGMYAAYLPLMFGLVRSRYSHDDTRRSISYLTGVLLFGILGSLVVVAMIARYAGSPTWAEWLPAGLALIGVASLVITRGQHAGDRTAQAREAAPRVDWAGFGLLAAGLALVLLALSEGPTWGWSSGRVIGCLVAGVLALAAWAAVELRVAEPLADVRFLFRPAFLPVYAVGFGLYFVAVGSQVVSATFGAAPGKLIGYGFGLDAFQLSLWGAFGVVFSCVAVTATPRVSRLIGMRGVMALGALFAVAGYTLLSIDHATLVVFETFLALAAFGLGFVESSTRIIVVDQLRDGEVAVGEGIYELAITVGGAVGSAVFAAITSANASKFPGLATERGYELSWVVSALVALLAVTVAAGYLLVGRSKKNAAAKPAAVPPALEETR